MEISFTNKDTKKEIAFTTDKNLIAIYGKNGVGKTTLSRIEDFEKKYVFNEDFIYSNVYNISEKGFSQSATTKENFSGLWLGEDIVKLRLEISEIQELEKEINQCSQVLKNQNILDINSHGINLTDINFDYDKHIEALKNDNFVLPEQSINEAVIAYNAVNNFQTSIQDDQELLDKTTYLKNNSIFNDLICKIQQSKILNAVILKNNTIELENINEKIKLLKTNSEIIDETENIFIKEKIDENLKNKIQDWYKIHENKKCCIFCGNNEIENALDKWKKVFKNDYIVEKNNLIKNIKTEIELCDKIVNEELYSNIDKDVIAYIKSISDTLKISKENIDKNIYVELKFINIPKEIKTIEVNELSKQIINYLLNKKLKEIEFYYNAKLVIAERKMNKTDELDKLMDVEGDKIAKNINDVFEKLGLNKNINIKVDKHSVPHKFTYNIENHSNISELSDGQKHKLALAIFINSIIDTNLKGKVIVIDDPVVSLDISSYILFKQFLIHDLIKNFADDTKLLLLTHDITYLYIQLSNIFDDKNMRDITVVYKLSGDKIEEIPIDYIKTDDISLFKLALTHCSNISELKVLNSIAVKIFRIIIDIRLRFYGISDTTEVGVQLLPISKEKINQLQKYSNHLSKVSREHNPKVADILLSIKYIKETTEMLGLNDYITDADLNKISEIIKENKTDEIKDELFIMIKEISDFLTKTTNKEMKGYVEHTRVSYTRNLIGLSLEDFFE